MVYEYDRRRASAQTDKMLDALKSSHKLKVTDGEKTFWILSKGQHPPYGYAPSKDGKKPEGVYRILSDDQVYNWLSKLKPV